MRFDYDVKHNGKWYPMGTDVPVGSPAVVEKAVVQEEKHEEPKQPVAKSGRKKKV